MMYLLICQKTNHSIILQDESLWSRTMKMRTPPHSVWKWENIWWLAFWNIQRSNLNVQRINLKQGNFLVQARAQLHNTFSHEFTDKKRKIMLVYQKLLQQPNKMKHLLARTLPATTCCQCLPSEKGTRLEMNYAYFIRWNRVQGKALKTDRLCNLLYGPTISEKKPDTLG